MCKYLGNHVTEEQHEQIKNGTFKDMEKFDYWIINGKEWVITGFSNYTNDITEERHTIIMPDWMKNEEM